MKKLFTSLFLATALWFGGLSLAPSIMAQTGPCATLACGGNSRSPLPGTTNGEKWCECVPTSAGQTDSDSVFGTIDAPEGVAKYNAAAQSETGSDIGLVLFLSNIIRIATIVAGIWVMVNFILAGWAYITSTGDSKAHSDASSKMTYSLTGLAIIVGAYTLAALIGLVFFGDASYILNPQLTGVGG